MRVHLLAALCAIGLQPALSLGQERPLFSIATFAADVTPDIGHPLQAGMGDKPVARVDDPLWAHGFVLVGGDWPIVLVSVDWCGIGNEAHDLWRSKLAEAAGTKPERVLVCAIHQHDAPLADLEAERLISQLKLGRGTLDLHWHSKTVTRVADALQRGLKNARAISHIGTGQAKVEKIASSRRILGKNGKVEMFRGSAMKDPQAKAAPEGLIDPWLKTLSFWNGDQALASISVYATHPMSYYGQGHVSSDFAGLARRFRQLDDPGVLHFYANGCGGNLAAGKYNEGSPEDRVQLTERLYKAWKSAWEQTKKQPLEKLEFRSAPYFLQPKTTDGFQVKNLEAILNSDKASYSERIRAAYALSWRRRCEAKHNLDLPVLDFGVAQLLLLPGEPFVEYQLFAQEQRPDSFVVTLGYGDYGPSYIPTDIAFEEGGYETGGWSFVAPGVEKALNAAIAKGLAAEAIQPPDAEQGYYEKRVEIVGVPRTADLVPASSATAETKAVLQNLRLTGVSYSGWTAEQAADAAKKLRGQGYNAVMGGGHRYLFSDVKGEKTAPNVVCGGTYEELLRDAKIRGSLGPHTFPMGSF